MIRVSLPYPPSVNHYIGSRGNRRFVKKAGVQFRNDVEKICAGLPKQTGELAVFVEAYPPDRRRRDIDNIQKCLLDALQHAGCYDDDCQIRTLHVTKCEPLKGGKVDVVVCAWRTVSQVRPVWHAAITKASCEQIA